MGLHACKLHWPRLQVVAVAGLNLALGGFARKGAHGVAGIIAKHGEETARRMPEVIAHGELGPVYEQGGKRNIFHGDDTAVLALVRHGQKLTWLLNGFRPEAEEKGK